VFQVGTLAASCRRVPNPTRDPEVLSFLPLVERIVHKVRRTLPRQAETDGLMGAGVVGLLQAMDRYDPSKGVAFEAYAALRIRGAVQDELRGLDHLTRTQRRKAQTAEAEGQDVAVRAVPFGAPLAYDPQVLDDTVVGSPWQDPADLEADLAQRERLAMLQEALQTAPTRDREVLGLYYDQELSLQEVGEVLGVSASRVSQLLSRSRARLRAQLQTAA
jgi:RNA polymerase sigma factor for flagellar operon FliA